MTQSSTLSNHQYNNPFKYRGIPGVEGPNITGPTAPQPPKGLRSKKERKAFSLLLNRLREEYKEDFLLNQKVGVLRNSYDLGLAEAVSLVRGDIDFPSFN